MINQVTTVPSPPTTVVSRCYVSTRSPLQRSAMIALPLGAVRPRGWLRDQLDLMVGGQVGHLEELSPFLTNESGWLGGEERGWEEAPYWLRGAYDLAQLTGDPDLRQRVNRWIEAVIASQDAEGYYGSSYNRLLGTPGVRQIVDVWPHMLMNDVLISHYEATGDERIIPMLSRFFAFCRNLPPDRFLPQLPAGPKSRDHFREDMGDWKPRIQLHRAGDLITQLRWLYDRTGEPSLIDLAILAYHHTEPAYNEWLDIHGVHFAQRFRYAAEIYPITRDRRYLDLTALHYRSFMGVWGQMPRGAYGADEQVVTGRNDPRQGMETCIIMEMNKSNFILGRITGDTVLADRVEDLTFNHLPASHAPDHRSLRYITACNMAWSVPDMDTDNAARGKATDPIFAADLHRCCQHNTGAGWTWFVKNMWQATNDNGLVAWLYGPNAVTARVGAQARAVTIGCETTYPFGDQVAMTVSTAEPVAFPLYLRIPGWCDEATLTVAGETTTLKGQGGTLARIERTWRDGDRVGLEFAMKVSATQWPRNGGLTIDRGPLSYSVRVKERWVADEMAGPPGWPRWTVVPDSSWNYGLAVDPEHPEANAEVFEADRLARQPWSATDAPIVIKLPARQIPDWQASRQHTVDPVREGPVKSDAPLETIELIPMGCAHLRMTVLPWVSDRCDARQWRDIPLPNQAMGA